MGTLPANISEPQPGVGKTGASGTVVTDMVTPLRELERSEIAKAIRIYGNDTEGKNRRQRNWELDWQLYTAKWRVSDDTAGKDKDLDAIMKIYETARKNIWRRRETRLSGARTTRPKSFWRRDIKKEQLYVFTAERRNFAWCVCIYNRSGSHICLY